MRKRLQCPICNGVEFAHGRLHAQKNGLFFRMGFFKDASVSGATCLSCGTVLSYLDDEALNKVREWHGKALKARTPP